MEDELRRLLKDFGVLVHTSNLKGTANIDNQITSDLRGLLVRYTEESIRVLRAGSPIGLAALLGALANTALIYALIPHLRNIQRLKYWSDKITKLYPKPRPEEVLLECSFFELIKISQDIGILRTVGLRKRIFERILSVHGFKNVPADYFPTSDFGLVRNTLHGIKTFRNVLHPGKLLNTREAKSDDFIQGVVSQGIILMAFFTDMLLSRDFPIPPAVTMS
jgi:hypothetical protein